MNSYQADPAPAVLIVQAQGESAIEDLPGSRIIDYRFAEEVAPGGLSSWPLSDAGGRLTLAVAPGCRGDTGSFREQALNRHFSRELLLRRPQWVLVRGRDGCALDLIRIADLFHFPVALDWAFDPPGETPSRSYPEPGPWLADCLRRVQILFHDNRLPDQLASLVPPERRAASTELASVLSKDPTSTTGLAGWSSYGSRVSGTDYAIREFVQRDPPLLLQMQAADVSHFEGCQRVLDLGSGAGHFLQLLKEAGVASATGVERNPLVAAYGRGMGLDIITDDALAYLERWGDYDGIYCSHFVEHLPMEAVERLLQGAAAALRPGGVLVLVFPDPESIRSQLLGFWRDPEHVRFYHPELLEGVAMLHGLELDWSSHEHPAHEVIPFPLEPPSVPAVSEHVAPLPESGQSGQDRPDAENGWSRLLSRFGLCSRRRYELLQADLREQHQSLCSAVSRLEQAVVSLTERTDQLWAVNRTWAWPDNAVLRFRKRGIRSGAGQ